MTDKEKESLNVLEARFAIKEVVDHYGYFADEKKATAQAELFTKDAVLEVYYDPSSDTPSEVVKGREALVPFFTKALAPFKATMHLIGQSSFKVKGDKGGGLVYCMAHHLKVENGKQKFMIAALRYQDSYVKEGGYWLISKRLILVDWIENR